MKHYERIMNQECCMGIMSKSMHLESENRENRNPFYFVAIFSKIVACVTSGIMRITNIQLEYTLVYV